MPNGGLDQIKGTEDQTEDIPTLNKGQEKKDPDWVEHILPEDDAGAAEEEAEEAEKRGEKIAKVILDRGGEGVSPEEPPSGSVDMPEGPTDQDPGIWQEPEDVEKPTVEELDEQD